MLLAAESAEAAVKDVFSLLRKTFRLFAARTPAGKGSLFHMFGTGTLKARLSYAARGTRGCFEERSEGPVNCRGMS